MQLNLSRPSDYFPVQRIRGGRSPDLLGFKEQLVAKPLAGLTPYFKVNSAESPVMCSSVP